MTAVSPAATPPAVRPVFRTPEFLPATLTGTGPKIEYIGSSFTGPDRPVSVKYTSQDGAHVNTRTANHTGFSTELDWGVVTGSLRDAVTAARYLARGAGGDPGAPGTVAVGKSVAVVRGLEQGTFGLAELVYTTNWDPEDPMGADDQGTCQRPVGAGRGGHTAVREFLRSVDREVM